MVLTDGTTTSELPCKYLLTLRHACADALTHTKACATRGTLKHLQQIVVGVLHSYTCLLECAMTNIVYRSYKSVSMSSVWQRLATDVDHCLVCVHWEKQVVCAVTLLLTCTAVVCNSTYTAISNS